MRQIQDKCKMRECYHIRYQLNKINIDKTLDMVQHGYVTDCTILNLINRLLHLTWHGIGSSAKNTVVVQEASKGVVNHMSGSSLLEIYADAVSNINKHTSNHVQICWDVVQTRCRHKRKGSHQNGKNTDDVETIDWTYVEPMRSPILCSLYSHSLVP